MASTYLLIILSLCLCTSAKYVKQKVETSSEFVFLTNFCYDTSGPGYFDFVGDAGNASSNIYLVLYDDESGSWSATYGSHLTCQQKVAKAKIQPLPIKNGAHQNISFNDHTRPHYWYMAIANCDGVKFKLHYEITMLQYRDNWNRQFSFDEEGLQLMFLLFFIVYIVGLGAHLYGDFQYLRARSLHPIIQLLSISIIFQFLSVMFYMIHYLRYAANGVGVPAMKVLGEIADIISVLIFMLLLILIAKGWGITHPTLSHIQEQKKILVGILAVIFVCYVTLFFWGQFGLNPATTLYVYQTVPGAILCVVRFLTLIYFIWCLQKTIREDSDSGKRVFYLIFGTSFGIWFLSLPLIVLLSLGLSSWYREKAVDAIVMTVTAVSYFGIGFLLWPSRASKYFQITGPDVFSSGYERL